MTSGSNWQASPTDRPRLDKLAEQFAGQWQPLPFEHVRGLLGRYLPAPNDALFRPALCQLILVDLDRRWQLGERPRLEDYLEHFPELGAPSDLPVFLLRGELRSRRAVDSSVSLEEYRHRFPKQFSELEGLESPSEASTLALPVDPAAQTAFHPPPPPPQRIVQVGGGYRLIERIGKGSYGEVWRAEAPGGIFVAVKIVDWPVGSPLTQMELRALELMKQLRHPYLIQLQAYWQTEGQVVMAMELADGSLQDLSDRLRREGREGIELKQLLTYMRQAAEALDYLHSENVVHRDIKPANILVVQGHAKIGDFGTARLRPSEMQDMRATMLGTPHYMAPEIWHERITPASDQYSLASTYVELRLHRPLFNPKNQMEAAWMHTEVKPDLNPLPKAEQRVLQKALAKRHEDRYPSCVEFVKALEQAIEPPQRSPWRAVALVTAGLVLAVSLGLVLIAAMSGQSLGDLVRLLVGQQLANQNDAGPVEPTITLPAGFVAARGANVEEVDGRYYYDRILREGFDAEFVLIKASSNSDPRTFYMMKDKVSNRLFARFAEENPDEVAESRWQEGTYAGTTQLLAEDHPDLPVFHVSVLEAAAFARWFGGNLPTYKQWDKAAGLYDRPEGATGPFGSDPQIGSPQGVAVRRQHEGPMPVNRETIDVSPFGCRDMSGNGVEWTRDLDTGRQVGDGTELRYESANVVVRGRSFMESDPLQYDPIAASPSGLLQPSGEPSFDITFRVVVEP